MKTGSTLTISDTSIKSFQIVQKAPFYFPTSANWNILSLPVKVVTSSRKTYIFPLARSQAFGYNKYGYYVADTLANGRGYWLKFYRGHQNGLEGFTISVDTLRLKRGGI